MEVIQVRVYVVLFYIEYFFFEWLSNLFICNVFLLYLVQKFWGRLKEQKINKILYNGFVIYQLINCERRKIK